MLATYGTTIWLRKHNTAAIEEATTPTEPQQLSQHIRCISGRHHYRISQLAPFCGDCYQKRQKDFFATTYHVEDPSCNLTEEQDKMVACLIKNLLKCRSR